MLKDLIIKNRSCRRYYQDQTMELETLKELVDLARLSPSGANLQPLKFLLSCDPETNGQIFPLLGWAAYLKDWPGPPEGERPAAYIVILNDKSIRPKPGCDHGIAAQSIMLGAVEKGWGGCIIATMKKAELSQLFDIADQNEVMLVLALGKPKEEVRIEPLGKDGDIKYWRDAEGVHHVPKRSLDDIILTAK
jgi:nitroreductase